MDFGRIAAKEFFIASLCCLSCIMPSSLTVDLTHFGSRGLCYLAIFLSLCVMAPKANVAQVVPDGYVLIWNYFGVEAVPDVIPIPVPLVPPAPGTAPRANVVQHVPDGYMLIWNDFVVPVPVVLRIPVRAPIPLVPPAPAVVGIVLDYWWEYGFFGCGENFAHDDVNVQWRQFYRQHRG